MSPLTRESLEQLDTAEPDFLADRINHALHTTSSWSQTSSFTGVDQVHSNPVPGFGSGSGSGFGRPSRQNKSRSGAGILDGIPGAGTIIPTAASHNIRRQSITPSSTSVSDDQGEDDEKFVAEDTVAVPEVREWAGSRTGKDSRKRSSLDKGKNGVEKKERQGGIGFNDLPMEILLRIVEHLNRPSDLASALLVSRSWCLATYPLLWHRPTFISLLQFVSFVRSVAHPSPILPWAASVRRLILTNLAKQLNDEVISCLCQCVRLERLVLSGATRVSADALKNLLRNLQELIGLDLSHIGTLHHSVVPLAAESCNKLQGINLTGCIQVNDDGISALARYCQHMRRIKLAKCLLITDTSMIRLAHSCPYLLELDLIDVDQLTDQSLYAILMNSTHLRELKMNHNKNITDAGFPQIVDMSQLTADELAAAIDGDENLKKYVESMRKVSEWKSGFSPRLPSGESSTCPSLPTLSTLFRPVTQIFYHLRQVDFTGCSLLNDQSIDRLTRIAPKLRSLTLAKCPLLTDSIAESISRLGKYLHYLHLGHVSQLSDSGIAMIVQCCSRLRYLDVACCSNLTDLSVFEIASNLTKVRRIGLVKVTKITDEALYALNDRWDTLERLHLSYCNNISVDAVAFMLNRMAYLTHLSLTGVSSFKKPEFQQFCRPPPSEFNEHQQASFCVFSGHGIKSLRTYLNSRAAARVASDDTSTGRESTSSLSSIVAPGRRGNRSPSPSPTMLTPGLHRASLPNLLRNQRDESDWSGINGSNVPIASTSTMGQSSTTTTRAASGGGGGSNGHGSRASAALRASFDGSLQHEGLRHRGLGTGSGTAQYDIRLPGVEPDYPSDDRHSHGHRGRVDQNSVQITNAWFSVPQQYPQQRRGGQGGSASVSGSGLRNELNGAWRTSTLGSNQSFHQSSQHLQHAAQSQHDSQGGLDEDHQSIADSQSTVTSPTSFRQGPRHSNLGFQLIPPSSARPNLPSHRDSMLNHETSTRIPIERLSLTPFEDNEADEGVERERLNVNHGSFRRLSEVAAWRLSQSQRQEEGERWHAEQRGNGGTGAGEEGEGSRSSRWLTRPFGGIW